MQSYPEMEVRHDMTYAAGKTTFSFSHGNHFHANEPVDVTQLLSNRVCSTFIGWFTVSQINYGSEY
jgi:hypothetical protein